MTLQELFRLCIAAGIQADPRSKSQIDALLAREKKRFDKADDDEKKYFDAERLWNPYADSRILYGTGEEEIQHLLVGIDTETTELLLADELRSNGTKIDAVMGHHPEGRSFGEIDQAMDVQVQIMKDMGVPENKSDTMLKERRSKIYRHIHARNLFRAEQAAQLLDVPFFNVHNPADQLVAKFMNAKICKKEWDSISDIIKALKDIEEYDIYANKGNPPIIANGSGSNRPGKVVLYGFNGATSGPNEFIEEMSKAGVGTFLSMHISEDAKKAASKHNINVIQCSHMASDTIGMNLLLDIIQKKLTKLQVTQASGFVRVKRK